MYFQRGVQLWLGQRWPIDFGRNRHASPGILVFIEYYQSADIQEKGAESKGRAGQGNTFYFYFSLAFSKIIAH